MPQATVVFVKKATGCDRLSVVVALLLMFASVLNVSGAQPVAEPLKLCEPIQIESGRVAGYFAGKKTMRVFKGIPYAAPPVGDLRWKPPRPVKPWKDVLECTEFGPVSPQPDTLARLYNTPFDKVSEDCLYLNIWTPAKSADEKLAVMVWIHGGANIMGGASTPAYDGQNLAKLGVVVVTINYRLGPFGFFAHPKLSEESGRGVSGNYGLLDQIAALQWVQKNIGAFGGDPARVTVFGESAGAQDICCLMASPAAKGLFQRAIAQSGHAFFPLRHLRESLQSQESMEAQGLRLASDLGCADAADPLAAMRGLSAEKILEVSRPTMGLGGETGYRFNMIIDGELIPDDVRIIFSRGEQHDVPLLVGTNANEGGIFMLNSNVATIEGYRTVLNRQYGPFADQVFALYPVSDALQIRKALGDSLGDLGFIAGARTFARLMGNVPSRAYLYHFTMSSPGPIGAMLGAFHGSEIAYVFGNLDQGRISPDQKHLALSEAMSAYWVQFAKTGDPNRDGLVSWPSYEAETDRHLEFGQSIKVGSGLRKEACDLADQIAASRNKPDRPGD